MTGEQEIRTKAKQKVIKKKIEREEEINFNKQLGIITDVKYLASQFIIKQPIYYDETLIWWLWDFKNYCWKKIDDIALLNAFDNLFSANTTDQKFKAQLVDAIKRKARLNKPKEAEKTWIQFKDTIVDVLTMKEFKATSEYFIVNPIPWKLGESEDTPILDKLFREWVVKKDTQDESYIETLKEVSAFIPLGDYPLHLIFCLIGAGMNGKGSFIRFIEKYVGDKNYTSSDWDLIFSSNFETSALYKKVLCSMGEIDKGIFKKTKWIKRLTGQDTIPMQFKHKPRFDAKNYAKIVIATNVLPETTDKTDGFYRRWCIVDFPNKFNERGQDIIEDIPDCEFENFARKSIKILNKVLIGGKITNQGTIEQRQKRYEERASPFSVFLRDNCIEGIEKNIPFWKIYDFYIDFLKQNNYRTISKIEFGRIIREKGFDVSKPQPVIKKDGTKTSWHYILGVDLKPEYSEEGGEF
jgi:P4 family phage/plasmid primase-like protien